MAPGGVPGVRYAEKLSGTFYLHWERFWLGVTRDARIRDNLTWKKNLRQLQEHIEEVSKRYEKVLNVLNVVLNIVCRQ